MDEESFNLGDLDSGIVDFSRVADLGGSVVRPLDDEMMRFLKNLIRALCGKPKYGEWFYAESTTEALSYFPKGTWIHWSSERDHQYRAGENEIDA